MILLLTYLIVKCYLYTYHCITKSLLGLSAKHTIMCGKSGCCDLNQLEI
jgi:hypothetical protein